MTIASATDPLPTTRLHDRSSKGPCGHAPNEPSATSIVVSNANPLALRIAEANKALAERQLERARAALGSGNEDHSRYARAVVQQAKAPR